ncbi:outer envelope pore protein 37, chloroplastic-like [Tasmannia lanceolata]|uniref:outer envelope pore protein 37, chloroplastic-like n=1 Tax=Tasmannia lanceolata TaxID=3420 RepID=UPI00406328A9
MVESYNPNPDPNPNPNPNSMDLTVSVPPPPQNPNFYSEQEPQISPPNPSFFLPVPAIRLTSEFDSDSSIFSHKISCKLFDSLAKFKLSFQNTHKGEVSNPQLGFITKYLSVLYDLETQNAFLKGAFDLGNKLQFKAAQDLKAQQGEMGVTACLGDPSYKVELSSAVPSIGLPKATFTFPNGEVTLEEKPDEEVKRVLSISGILKGQVMNGICTAQFRDNNLNVRYLYKDEQLSIIPSISVPSNALSFAFKRRFSPSDKLSYWYNFDSSFWSAVYKHKIGKDLKFKAGYDSEVRLGWASLWVGDEDGKLNIAPNNMKVQLMLQVPQDDISSSIFMFRIKKRWDLLS